MKRIFTKLFAVLLACCTLLSLASCGKKEEGTIWKNQASKNPEYKTMNKADALAYLTEIKNANPAPSTLSLKDGILVQVYDMNKGSYTIADFKLYLQEVGGVLMAQGSFKIKAGDASAESKFYHDGKYLGIETTENGQVDKQKEELPLSAIGNLIGYADFIKYVTEYLADLPTIDDFIEKNQGSSADPALAITTYTGANCIRKDFIKLDDYINQIALDTSYNIIGTSRYYSELQSYIFCEITDKTVTIPEDFGSWTLRPAA